MKHLLFTLFLLFHHCINAQLTVDSLISKQAISLYQKAEDIATQENPDFQKYIHYAEKALPLLKQSEQWEPYIWTLIGLMNTTNYTGKFQQSREYAKALEVEITEVPISRLFLVDKVARLTTYYKNLSDYEKARSLTQWAEDIVRKEDIANLGILNNLGFMYRLYGDEKKGLDYYLQAIAAGRKAEPVNHILLSNTLTNIGVYYQSHGNFQESFKYLQEAANELELVENIEYKKRYLATNYTYLSIYYQHLGNYSKAEKYLQQVFELKGIPATNYARAWHYLGVNAYQEGNLPEAIQLLEKALEQKKRLYEPTHISIAQTLRTMGEVYYDLQDSEQSLISYQKAMGALIKDFKDTLDWRINPKLDRKIISKLELFKVLPQKAKALIQLGALDKALSTYTLSIELISAIQKDIFTAESKLLLRKNAQTIFESAIALAFELYERSGDDTYLNSAFELTEKSKAKLLLESILESEALGASLLPKSIIEQLKELKIKRGLYERSLLELDSQKDPERFQEVQLAVLNLDQDLARIFDRMETDFPRYYQARYNSQIPSLQDVQKNILSKDDLMLEYFYGEQHIYIFSFSKAGAHLQRIPRTDALDQNLKAFLDFFTDPNKIIRKPTSYQEVAHLVYQDFLEAALQSFPKTKNLTIIPDGRLAFIPFDALIPSKQTGAYLIEKLPSQIAYSCAILNSPRSMVQVDGKLLAMAPIFEKREHALNPLLNSEAEIMSIPSNKKEILAGADATLQAFRSQAVNYPYLHLSTHAAIDPGTEEPVIYFIDSLLYLPELYTLNLNAELVTLSACNTNSGELVKGEGVLSLARGFSQAGVRNLVATLWEVQDQTSKEILLNFYKHLFAGNSINESLHRAKIDYLKESSIPDYLKSPYYWAPYEHIVNANGATEKAPYKYTFYIIIICLLSIAFPFFYQRKKS